MQLSVFEWAVMGLNGGCRWQLSSAVCVLVKGDVEIM